MLRIGAHLSIAGGYSQALTRAVKIGANALQIFSASPRGWNFANPTETEIERFKEKAKELDIKPVYFHASYLINLANTERIGETSKKMLINELRVAQKVGVVGSIIHLGSFKGNKTDDAYKSFIKNISDVLENIPSDVLFIAENSAVNKIGKELNELAQIVTDLKDERLKICLDTCHLFAAGYPIHTKEGLEETLNEFDKLIGLDKLEVVHLNDSRDVFGSTRDRHANIGQGYIREEAFGNIINHPQLRDLPFIIETPGFQGGGPDKDNIQILKNLYNSNH